MRVTAYFGAALLLLAGGASTASAQVGNQVDITYIKSLAIGEAKITGRCTAAGGGWQFYRMKIEIGEYQLQPDPNNPGKFINVFVAAASTGTVATNPTTTMFTGLTSGKTYIVRVTGYFQWTGLPPQNPDVKPTEQSLIIS